MHGARFILHGAAPRGTTGSPLVAAPHVVISIDRLAVGRQCFIELLLYQIHILQVVFLWNKDEPNRMDSKNAA